MCQGLSDQPLEVERRSAADVRGEQGGEVAVALEGADVPGVPGGREGVALVAGAGAGGGLLGADHVAVDVADDVAGAGVAHHAAVGVVVRAGAVVGVGGADAGEEEGPEGGDGGGCADTGHDGLPEGGVRMVARSGVAAPQRRCLTSHDQDSSGPGRNSTEWPRIRPMVVPG